VRRYLVIYYDGNGTKAALIDDDDSDGTVTMPFGISPEQVADDCVDITAIILCADPPHVPFVVIDDQEFDLTPGANGVEEEDVPAADEERICGQCSTVVPAATVDADGDCEDCAALKD
jgi:hypothetical protein